MAHWLLALLVLLWSLSGAIGFAADPGDGVFFTGQDELDVPILKDSGNRVLTEASTVSERPPALVATTENIVLSGEQSIDQIVPEDEEEPEIITNLSRVLVHLQTDPTENGIYVSSSGAWTRAIDADHTDEMVNNFTIYVQSGVVYGQTSFRLTTTGTITLGSTPINFIPLPSARLVPLSELPVDPAPGTSYLVSEHDGTCQAPGTVTQRCEWDGDSWELLGGGGGSTLDAACAAGTACAFTNLPPERPQIWAPEGLNGVQVRRYGVSGSIIDDCVDGSTLVPCQPSYTPIFPGQTQCLEMVVLDDPATEICVNSLTVTESGGIGTGVTRSDRGTYANLPLDPYVDQTYIVNNCLNASCTAGGGTVRVVKQWTGSAWINLTGTAAAGDIEAVWGCSAGDCSALTAAAGDSLDAGAATASSPTTRSTSLPGTCTEGQQHQNTTAGGSETYVCTATNTWVKFQSVLPWEIPFSAAGLVVDGTNCVQQTSTQINSGMFTRPVVCGDAPGTLETSFLSPTRWDGTPLTVSFVIVDPSTTGVWSANVEALCRTPSTDTLNNTWGAAVPATVTLTTVNIPYLATAVVTPNTGCAGGDFVAIRATILNATTHTDNNARVVGGMVRGSQL